MRKQNTKKIQWPCGRCKKNCETSCVFCAICEKWYHCDCESVPLGKLKTISDNPEDYICETCRCEDGKFDFLMGLERLKQVGFFFYLVYYISKVPHSGLIPKVCLLKIKIKRSLINILSYVFIYYEVIESRVWCFYWIMILLLHI